MCMEFGISLPLGGWGMGLIGWGSSRLLLAELFGGCHAASILWDAV